eukprot:761468-Hanusia_phi.AAC.1
MINQGRMRPPSVITSAAARCGGPGPAPPSLPGWQGRRRAGGLTSSSDSAPPSFHDYPTNQGQPG